MSDEFIAGIEVELDQASTVEEVDVVLGKIDAEEERIRGYNQRLSVLRIRAARRRGELLGPASAGRPTKTLHRSNVSGAERVQQHRDRAAFAIPEEKVEEYLKNEQPTLKGLLREHGPKPQAPRPSKTSKIMSPSEAYEFLQARVERIRTGLDKQGKQRPRWSDRDLESVKLVVALQRTKKGSTWGGKRKRKLYEEIREDGDTRLRRLMVDISDATRKLEHMELPDDVGLGEEPQDDIAWLYSDLMTLKEWAETQVAVTMAHMGDMTRQRTIRKLRLRAQDPSSAPQERISATIAADRLQEKYRGELERGSG